MAEGIVAEVEYRDIPGFDGYRAGSDGTIWSCWRMGGAKNPKGAWRMLKAKKHVRSDHRYVSTKFRKDSPVHQLVLFAFVGPKPDGMECRHLNGDASDNRPENLAWGTRLENVHDSINHGTFRSLSSNRKSDFCTEEGCSEPFYAKDRCSFHYRQHYRKMRKQRVIPIDSQH